MAAIEQPAPPPAPATPRGAGGWRELGELTTFAGEALATLVLTPRRFATVFVFAASILRRGSVLLFIMSGFMGVSAATAGVFILRAIGASDYAGLISGYTGPRFAAVTAFGYVFAGSICCAVAAELGSAKIQQEIDAYESQGVDPMRELVATRLAAAILAVPIFAIVALLGFYAGGYLLAVELVGVNSAHVFSSVSFSLQSIPGQFYAALMMLGIAIPCMVVACFYGLRAYGGPPSVGQAVARSLAVNIVLVHVITSAVGVVIYGSDAQLPIGG